MKKIAALILVLVMCLSLCACVNAMSEEKMDAFLITLSDSKQINSEDCKKTLEKCMKTEEFDLLLETHMSDLLTEGNYSDAANLISRLDKLEYPSCFICEQMMETHIIGLLIGLLTEGDYSAAMDLISELDELEYPSCFVYETMRDYFETNAQKAIVQNDAGGYYDEIQDEFENEYYWYSPLFKEKYSTGSIGTYRYTRDYEFMGDFMIEFEEEYWYDTSVYDTNNSFNAYVYFKGNYVFRIKRNESIPPMDNVYYLETGEDSMFASENYVFVSVEDDQLMIIYDHEKIAVACE